MIMTAEEGFRVSDLVASANLVLRLLWQGETLTKADAEVVWLQKTADAVRMLLPEKDRA
jgi:hypothetical protein